MIVIYGLICPLTGDIRYVGKTSQKLDRRLSAHVSDAFRNHHSHKQRWIVRCIEAGVLPEIHVLEAVGPADKWQDREREWIQKSLKAGHALMNQTAGGEGLDYLDQEAKLRYRKNLSAAMKKWASTEGGRAAIAKTLSASQLPAVKEKRRNSIRAAWRDETARKNLAVAMSLVRARPEYKSAKSKGSKQGWENHRQSILSAFARPETKAKQSARKRKSWSDPAARHRMMNRWTPEARALQAQRIRERQALIQSKMTPEVRAKQGAKLKETWARRKAGTI